MSSLFFIIFIITIFFLSVDSVISLRQRLLVEQTTSFFGVSLFVCISAIFILGSLFLFRFITDTTSEVRANFMHLRILHNTTLVTQMALIAILVLLLIQMAFLSEYYTLTLIATSLIVSTVSAGVTAIACLILISWYRFNRGSYVVLIFAVAFATNAYIFALYCGHRLLYFDR